MNFSSQMNDPCKHKKVQILSMIKRFFRFLNNKMFKPGAWGQRMCMPSFLKSFLFTSVCLCMCVCVCLSPRTLITCHMKHMHNNQIKQFYGFSISYMVLAIDKLNGHGLSNNACLERLPKKTEVTWY